MKKIILFCFTYCFAFHVSAQDDVSVFFAPTSSTFKYTDSQGNKDPNIRYQFRPSFGLNYPKVFNSGVFIRPELGYKNFGAISLLNDQKVDWSLHYLDFNIGCGYQKHFGSVVPFAGIAPYFSYLFKGKETFGSTVYDLLGDNGLKRIDWGLNIFAGVKYQITKANSLFVEIRNVTGLWQLEKNSVNGQNEKTYNRALSFHFGISFNIVKGVKRKEETPEKGGAI
jgi:hypothetical protein